MAGYRRQKTDGPNSEEKALDLFAEMMIEKIESISKDWRKPWFTEGVLQWPRNLSGREYNGMNALMLLLHCEKEGYKIPRFCTFDCVQRMNKPGKDGQELPRVSVPVDRMINENLWICPIHPRHQDEAYYSMSKNEIVVPEKGQFKDGEAFYGTLFHEMTHSTGAEGVLDRLKPTSFGSKEYAREELVAELGSALVSQRYGMTKHIKEDSCAYLKSWLDELKESPQFIKTTLLDVKRATSLITQRVDRIAQGLDEGMAEGKDVSPQERTFYSSVAYLQSTDDTSRLDELKDKGDYKVLLACAKEYYDGNGMDEQYTYQTPLQHRDDDLLIEDKDFAVVYNGSVGGTYEVMLKFSEQEVRDHIDRYGIGRASVDVKEVARR